MIKMSYEKFVKEYLGIFKYDPTVCCKAEDGMHDFPPNNNARKIKCRKCKIELDEIREYHDKLSRHKNRG